MQKIKLNLEDELFNFAIFNKLDYKPVINKNIFLDNRVLLIYAMKNKINIALLKMMHFYQNIQISNC